MRVNLYNGKVKTCDHPVDGSTSGTEQVEAKINCSIRTKYFLTREWQNGSKGWGAKPRVQTFRRDSQVAQANKGLDPVLFKMESQGFLSFYPVK